MRLYPTLTVDGEFKTLRDAGYTGSLNDMQFTFLRAEGYVGSLTDMHSQFTGGEAPGGTLTWTMTAGNNAVNFADGYRGGPSFVGSISNEPIEGLELRFQAGGSASVVPVYSLAFENTGPEVLSTLESYGPLRYTVTDLTNDNEGIMEISGWTEGFGFVSATITYISNAGNSGIGYPYAVGRSYLCTLTSI